MLPCLLALYITVIVLVCDTRQDLQNAFCKHQSIQKQHHKTPHVCNLMVTEQVPVCRRGCILVTLADLTLLRDNTVMIVITPNACKMHAVEQDLTLLGVPGAL